VPAGAKIPLTPSCRITATYEGKSDTHDVTIMEVGYPTIEYQVGSIYDDTYAWESTSQNSTTAYLKVGYHSNYDVPYYMSGVRFTNVNIPKGAVIISAYLKIHSYNSDLTGSVYGKIQAEATDDADGFLGRYLAGLAKTSASVNWDHTTDWSANTWYTSPNIAGVVQEVIDRSGWSENNSLAIFYSAREASGGYRYFSSYDRDGIGSYAPKLEITYNPTPPPKYTISGRVTYQGSGLADVSMGGLGVVTDVDGYYSGVVSTGWSGTVTPSKSGYNFSPPSISYSNVTSDKVNQDYTAIPSTLTVIYVDMDAQGANNGSSWFNAYTSLQDALTASFTGDEIRVAQGIYKPDGGVGITLGDRDASFQLINGVAVKGGYAGFGEPNPNARDIKLYETILSGDLNGNDVQVSEPCDLLDEPTRVENSYHVVSSRNTDASAVLDGVTIIGGNANGNLYFGGGIYNENPPTQNWECTTDGPTISNCRIIKNSAAGEGGGMCNRYSCQPQIINCDFIENMASWSGGGIKNDTSDPTIINCSFEKNYAVNSDSSGGGIDNEESSPTLTNCIFITNYAYYGGAIGNWMGNCSPKLVNCIFSKNSAEYGGVMWTSNNWEIGSGTHPELINCSLVGNSAVFGNALACTEGYFEVIPSDIHLTNCILWNGGNEIWNSDGSTIRISYGDIQGGWSGPGANNINVNPNLADADNGDFHLLAGSQCIDAGDNSAVPAGITADLDGKPRFSDDPDTTDTGNGTPPIVDMGAYEFAGGTTHPADTNSDYVISMLEILGYIDQWAVGDVSMLEVLEGIDLWAAGQYYWDESEQKFKPGEHP